MSIIKIPILYEGDQGEIRLNTLFDSGANLSCISEDFAGQISTLLKFPKPKKIATAAIGHFIEISHIIRSDFYIDDIQLSDEFLVVPGLSKDAIIGAATLQKWRIKLNFETDKVEVDPKVAKLQVI